MIFMHGLQPSEVKWLIQNIKTSINLHLVLPGSKVLLVLPVDCIFQRDFIYLSAVSQWDGDDTPIWLTHRQTGGQTGKHQPRIILTGCRNGLISENGTAFNVVEGTQHWSPVRTNTPLQVTQPANPRRNIVKSGGTGVIHSEFFMAFSWYQFPLASGKSQLCSCR